MANILYLEWNSFGAEEIKRAWDRNGDTVEVFQISTRDNTRYGAELTKSIAMTLMSQHFDYMFSFNFFPVAAMAAKACKVRYVSWVYDNPYAQLYSETIKYPTNDVRLFDKQQVYELNAMGIDTVSYLPLAADVESLEASILKARSEDRIELYKSDISFVGSLYTEEKQQLYSRLDKLDDYYKGYVDSIIDIQKKLYGVSIVEEAINPDLLEQLEKASPLMEHPDAFATKAWTYANYYLYRKITALERTEILTMLSEKYGDGLKVYTHEQSELSKVPDALRVAICPSVDSRRIAPLIYNQSKINLNISLRSIKSGVPLRCFEIMGSGGFLMSNYQADLFDLFEADKDFVFYSDYEDLLAKIEYYLKHDDERSEIAHNGYEKVKATHTFMHRLKKL